MNRSSAAESKRIRSARWAQTERARQNFACGAWPAGADSVTVAAEAELLGQLPWWEEFRELLHRLHAATVDG